MGSMWERMLSGLVDSKKAKALVSGLIAQCLMALLVSFKLGDNPELVKAVETISQNVTELLAAYLIGQSSVDAIKEWLVGKKNLGPQPETSELSPT